MPKPRILVIDDDAGVRESLRMTLEYDGYDVAGAATGVAAYVVQRRVRSAPMRVADAPTSVADTKRPAFWN